jgi:hypothetical protein
MPQHWLLTVCGWNGGIKECFLAASLLTGF